MSDGQRLSRLRQNWIRAQKDRAAKKKERVLALYLSGMSEVKVAKELGISNSLVSLHCRTAGVVRSVSERMPRGSSHPFFGKHRSDKIKTKISQAQILMPKHGYETPTSDLAYIIGVLMGDASIHRTTIRLDVKDREFAETFTTALRRQFGLNTYSGVRRRNSANPRWGDVHYVAMTSRPVSEFLREIRNIDWVQKLPDEYRIAWVRDCGILRGA